MGRCLLENVVETNDACLRPRLHPRPRLCHVPHSKSQPPHRPLLPLSCHSCLLLDSTLTHHSYPFSPSLSHTNTHSLSLCAAIPCTIKYTVHGRGVLSFIGVSHVSRTIPPLFLYYQSNESSIINTKHPRARRRCQLSHTSAAGLFYVCTTHIGGSSRPSHFLVPRNFSMILLCTGVPYCIAHFTRKLEHSHSNTSNKTVDVPLHHSITVSQNHSINPTDECKHHAEHNQRKNDKFG